VVVVIITIALSTNLRDSGDNSEGSLLHSISVLV